MKQIFGLMLCLCAAGFTACGDDKTDEANKWFENPRVENVSGTMAVVVCPTLFGESILVSGVPGFAYAPIVDSGIGEYRLTSDVTVDGTVITCRLTGLSPETVYVGYAFVRLGGQQLESKPIVFQTEPMGEEDRELPQFGALASAEVASGSATVSGSFTYDGDKPVSEVYFAYTAAGITEKRAAVSTSTGDKSARLTELTSSTAYTFSLCVVVDGQTYKSAATSFTTLSGGVTPPPVDGNTKYAGWAELPEEVDNSDYHYAYHMRDDAKSIRNYSVCYSAEMNCPIWVAYPMHTSYTQGSAGGQNKAWRFDPIIPSFVQPNLSSSYEATGDGSYSRGHMCASGDRQVTVTTNKQTFYYTNMAPQTQNGFNGGIWSKLENWCRSSNVLCSDTLYMVTGSYYANKNKKCQDNSKPAKTVYVPTHFYKVLIRSKSGNTGKPLSQLSADQIQCVVWWFEHKVYSGELSASYLRSVADVERDTGLTFFSNVPNAPKEAYNRTDWGL